MRDVKRELKASRPVFGVFMAIPSPQLVEVVALEGFDFVIIDEEHGSSPSSGATESLVLSAYASSIYPVVRVPCASRWAILRPLDLGAKGVQVPLVCTRGDAEAVVGFAKYPPLGTRGAAFSTRMGRYGLDTGPKTLQRANEESLIVVHVENQQGMDHLDEILQVPGVDVVFIGPTDLSVSLGHPSEMDHPVVKEAIGTILEKTLGARLQAGIYVTGPEDAERRREQGFTYLATGIAGLVMKGCRWMLGK